MAAFPDMATAEAYGASAVAAKAVVNAHVARTVTGTICVRLQPLMTAAHPDYGGWEELTTYTP